MKGIHKFLFGTLLFSIYISGCNGRKPGVFFELLSPQQTGVDFINQITESDTVNVVSFTNIYNGGGVGVADFNRDGLQDLLFTGNMVSSRLYINQSAERKIQFRDISDLAGIFTDRWATGVSIADINNDGWPDIYICVSGSDVPENRRNYLFIHQGLNEDGIPYFSEMAARYGVDDDTYSTQAAFFDHDLDGDLDLYVAVNFADQFYGATVNIPTPSQKGYTERSDRLYENTGIGREGHPVFKDISVKAGILHEGYTLGLVIQDINLDGWPDIYQANDFLSNDIYYENQGDGTFINRIGEYFKHTTFAGMGMDISDINNDGWPDIFVLDMTPADNLRQKSMMLPVRRDRFTLNLKAGYYPQYNRNTLQLNSGYDPEGILSFSEIGQLAGVHHTDWSWTSLFSDLDNSGFRDLMICNGFRRDLQDIDHIHYLFGDNPFGTREYWEQQFVQKVKEIPGIFVNNYLMENNGDLTFSDRSEEWGFNHPSYSNGGVTVDLDNDGDLDVVINNLDDHPFIYENRTIMDKIPVTGEKENNYIKITFADNLTDAITFGTKFTVRHGGRSQYYQHYLVRGYLSTLDPVIHFGLGKDTLVSRLAIKWPDGQCQDLENISANQVVVIEKVYGKINEKMNEEKCDHIPEKENTEPLFKNVNSEAGLDFLHKEFEFNDFNFQPMLLQMHSRNGPGMAAGDVNGDKLEDLIVGGARGQATIIFIQEETGGFRKQELAGSGSFEDMGLLLIDADQDGDLDLYAVSGSSEFPFSSASYRDRFYENNGQGHFMLNEEAIPEILSSGSCVLSADFDRDGDPDLFIGGRIRPREYPYTPESYLLRNESGENGIRFVEVTDTWGPSIKKTGMVSSGLFTDFNNDGLIDLVLVGEWMPVRFFENTGTHFQLVEGDTGLEYSNGWWNSISGGDFDKDGDMDYIAGNLGLNSWLKADKNEPLSLYADDFDRDGQVDPLIFHYVNGRNVPFHSRSMVTMQMSFLEKKFPTYKDFATAGLEDILTEEQRALAEKYYSYEFRTSYIENLGGNKFKLHSLPLITQTAPMYGILIDDFDDDGNYDVLLEGNSKASNLTLGWYDASIGYFLKGNGDGSFSAHDGTESHFFVDRDAKSLVQLGTGPFEPLIVAANNDDSLMMFRRRKTPASSIWITNDITSGLLYLKDDTRQKIEFYKGSGYLSSLGNRVYLGHSVRQVDLYNSANELVRTVVVE